MWVTNKCCTCRLHPRCGLEYGVMCSSLALSSQGQSLLPWRKHKGGGGEGQAGWKDLGGETEGRGHRHPSLQGGEGQKQHEGRKRMGTGEGESGQPESAGWAGTMGRKWGKNCSRGKAACLSYCISHCLLPTYLPVPCLMPVPLQLHPAPPLPHHFPLLAPLLVTSSSLP